MTNYIGYFRDADDDQISVSIIADTASSSYTEVGLSGDGPFTLNYSDSQTIFEPSRSATANISIIHSDYMLDCLSPSATGTRVLVKNETENTVLWCGYLTPNLYNSPYENCYDNFELTANDLLNTLTYIDYSTIGSHKSIVTFKQILQKICDINPDIKGFKVLKSKKAMGATAYTQLDQYKISEQNFYSSDTDEPWKLSEVLDEICKYAGYTAVQWRDEIYLIDYAHYTYNNATRENFFSYLKANSYASGSSTGEALLVVSGDTYRGSGGNISCDNIYNKVKVNCNFYDVDKFIPEIFKQDSLTNRLTNEWDNQQINYGTAYKPYYMKTGDNKADEETYDTYWRKLYDNKYYESVYRNWKNQATVESPSEQQKKAATVTRDFLGGTIIDFATIADGRTLSQGGDPNANYEAAGDISFKKYLLLSQLDMPYRYTCADLGNSGYYVHPKDDTPSNVYNTHPALFQLKSGYYNPIIHSTGSYVAIDVSAIWERYWKAMSDPSGQDPSRITIDFINQKWATTKDTGAILRGDNFIRYRPYLVFILKIGLNYWNGTQWTTTPSAFPVKMSCDVEDGEPTYNNWNQEFSALNNFDWSGFTGLSGYKIPLEGDRIDSEIYFAVGIPAKLEKFMNENYATSFRNCNGFNGYVWITNLNVGVSCEGNEIAKDYDIIYQGYSGSTINPDAVNELSEITLKITTCPLAKQRLSYSNVGYIYGYLSGVSEEALSGTLQEPEKNIIEKYIKQYSTPTIKEQITLSSEISPVQLIRDAWWGNTSSTYKYFVVAGQSIDFATKSQTLTIIEKKR